MKKIKSVISSLLHIALLCFISVLISKYLSVTKPFEIKTIKVSGNKYIDNKQVLEIIKEYTENQNILNIKLDRMNSKLEKNEFIYITKSYTKFPSILFVEIEELIPLALFEKNQKFYFMDNSKNLIEANYRAINHYFNTPVITNLSNQKIDLDKIRYVLIEILNNSNLIYEKLNEVHYLTDNIILILNNNTKIILKSKDYENNLNKFLSFNKQVLVKNNMNIDDYKYINVSISDQIITREKNI